MAKTEVILRPGDSLSVKLELAGQALRLDLSIGHDGVVIAPPAARPNTRQIMPPAPPPVVYAPPPLEEPQPEFSPEDDTSASREKVHEEDEDIDMDVADLGPEQADGPADFSPMAATMLPPTQAAEPAPIELDDASFAPESAAKPGTRPVVPATAPAPHDTLPPWQGGARAYKDPALEKKKATAALVRGAMPLDPPAPKPPTAKIQPQPAPPADGWEDGDGTGDSGGNTIFAVGPSQPVRSAPGVIPDGDYTVFLTPPKSDDKKQAAARVIMQVQGGSMADALALAGKMIVPVAKNVTEDRAHQVRDMFKAAGLACRITQKR